MLKFLSEHERKESFKSVSEQKLFVKQDVHKIVDPALSNKSKVKSPVLALLTFLTLLQGSLKPVSEQKQQARKILGTTEKQ